LAQVGDEIDDAAMAAAVRGTRRYKAAVTAAFALLPCWAFLQCTSPDPNALKLGTGRPLGRGRSRVQRRASDDAEDAESSDSDVDWREFRARLVQQEQGDTVEGISQKKTDRWAYESPVIEQGSILLSAPNDHFAINQQYFHKNVIFLVNHSNDFTKGVILNRPTAFSTTDVETTFKTLENFSHEGADDWNVWCGGDCQGINERGDRIPPEYSVLHGLKSLASYSEKITQGVYSIELEQAKKLVASGEADKDDFLLLVGYCGWGPNQLQSELDRSNTWTMASMDPGTLLGELRTAQSNLRKRINAASAGDIFTAKDVGDGIEMWERLYKALGEKYQETLESFVETGDNDHTDEMLRRWINRCLIPPKYSPERLPESKVVEELQKTLKSPQNLELTQGTVLRGSATAWLLGKPAEDPHFDMKQFLPGQYFHKSVVLLIKPDQSEQPDMRLPQQSIAMVTLLNGPQIGREKGGPVHWGGPQGSTVIKVQGSDESVQFRGFTILFPGALERLLELGAFEVSEAGVLEVLKAPMEERWEVAGGTIDSVSDAQSAQLGDVQRKKWFKRFLEFET